MCAHILVGEARPYTSENVLLDHHPNKTVLRDGADGYEVSALPGTRRLSLLYERSRNERLESSYSLTGYCYSGLFMGE